MKAKTKKLFADISDSSILQIIESSLKFPIPDCGIHRPMLWKGKKNCGVLYKVMTAGTEADVKSRQPASCKSDVIKLKWKFNRGRFKPESGYEEFIHPINESNSKIILDQFKLLNF